MTSVVVVDDDVDAADSLALALQACGFEVRTAYGGREAVDLIATTGPDAVVSDLEMPGVCGLEEVAEVRALQSKQPLMIAVTGAASADLQAKALAAGFDAFLAKPTSLPELVSALESAPQAVVAKGPDRA